MVKQVKQNKVNQLQGVERKKIVKEKKIKEVEVPKQPEMFQQVKRIHLSLKDTKLKIDKLLVEIEKEEVKNSKTKRKRLYHQLAQLKKAVQNPNLYLIDPEYEKKKRQEDKARRIEKKLQQAEEKRKKEKNEQRHKKRCLNCGSKDHLLSQCQKVQSGFCYKCGSSEHTHTECEKDTFVFASCFVCGEKGHISRQCAQNQKGLYRKGGSCFGCGSVRHTLKDCPKRHAGKFINQQQEF